MNRFERWYYVLTEKQSKKIALISAIIFYIFFASLIVSISISAEYSNSNMLLLIKILLLVADAGMSLCIYILTYALLWYLPDKREYLHKKEHDEIIIPKVRGKFGLGPEFKEVLYSPKETDYDFSNSPNLLNKLGVKYFAKEMDGVILVSIRDKDGEELVLQEINNYYFFDSNFKPKE